MGRGRGASAQTQTSGPVSRGRTAPSAVFKANCAFKAPQCTDGHDLSIAICRIGSKVCNGCMRRIKSTYTHRCDQCDYDLCRKCYSREGQEAAEYASVEDVSSPPWMFSDGSPQEHDDEFWAAVQVQLRDYEDLRRTQGVSTKRLQEEKIRLQEELRLQNELRRFSDMQEEPSMSLQSSQLAQPLASTSTDWCNSSPPGSACLPPWLESPWRTSRQPRALLNRRKQEMQLIYGDYRHQAQKWMSPATSENDEVYRGSFPPVPSSAPSAPLEHIAARDGEMTTRQAPRTAPGNSRHWRRRNMLQADLERPCVDDLRRGFGRTQWEFA